MSVNPRLLALRLACMEEGDRNWIYSRLSPAEVTRLEGLLADLRQGGLLRNPDALRGVLAELEKTKQSVDAGLVAWLDGLDKPVWRVLALQGLPASERNALSARYCAGHSLLYRQLSEAFASQALPEGWKTVLLPPSRQPVRALPVQEA